MNSYDWNAEDIFNGLNHPEAEDRELETQAEGSEAHEAASEAPETPEVPETQEPTAEPSSAEPQIPSYQNSYYAYSQAGQQRPAQEPYAGWNSPGSQPLYGARPAQYAGPQYRAPVSPQPQGKTKKHAGGFGKRAVALALACTLLGGAAGVGGSLLVNRLSGNRSGSAASSSTAVQVASPRETVNLQTVTVDSGKLLTASQVYKANVNSTVGITTEITTTNGWGFQSTGAAAGSGFILTEDGYILTNEHVIEKANSITVAMYDGTTYPAELVGYDGSNDIAVLKIDAKGLTPVVLGDSESLEVGDEVIAIGNPLGELTFSLTKGNVSALNRAVTLSSKVTMSLIQTDAAINSGNSGGALFNMYGEVVGITNAKYSTSGFSGEASIDNIGFAIPINSVREIVSSIIEKGYISKPYIGVTVGNVSEESQSYGMPQGAAIRSVEEGGPAAEAGLQANDIVTAVNGQSITSYEEFAQLISDAGIGGKLELTVYRQGESLKLSVEIGEKRQDAIPSAQESQNSQGQSGNSQEGQNGQSGQDGSGQNGWGSDDWGADPFGWGTFPFGWGFGG